MPTFLALLRGVNVGKSKRVPMGELRALLANMDYTGVATVLNSGNAVFRAPRGTAAKHAADISAAISTQLKIEVPVIVKSASELAAIIAENPIEVGADQHPRFLVAFLQDSRALSGLTAIESLVMPPEQFAMGKNAAYLLCAAGILESKAAQVLLGKASKWVTTRNWATVLKLQALTNEADA
jgi:uncharacterized protein (DUF1697 family)